MEITGSNTKKALEITEKVKNFQPIAELKEKLTKEIKSTE
jgi:hypothetical protein